MASSLKAERPLCDVAPVASNVVVAVVADPVFEWASDDEDEYIAHKEKQHKKTISPLAITKVSMRHHEGRKGTSCVCVACVVIISDILFWGMGFLFYLAVIACAANCVHQRRNVVDGLLCQVRLTDCLILFFLIQ